jgi:hypothetical protein
MRQRLKTIANLKRITNKGEAKLQNWDEEEFGLPAAARTKYAILTILSRADKPLGFWEISQQIKGFEGVPPWSTDIKVDLEDLVRGGYIEIMEGEAPKEFERLLVLGVGVI